MDDNILEERKRPKTLSWLNQMLEPVWRKIHWQDVDDDNPYAELILLRRDWEALFAAKKNWTLPERVEPIEISSSGCLAENEGTTASIGTHTLENLLSKNSEVSLSRDSLRIDPEYPVQKPTHVTLPPPRDPPPEFTEIGPKLSETKVPCSTEKPKFPEKPVIRSTLNTIILYGSLINVPLVIILAAVLDIGYAIFLLFFNCVAFFYLTGVSAKKTNYERLFEEAKTKQSEYDAKQAEIFKEKSSEFEERLTAHEKKSKTYEKRLQQYEAARDSLAEYMEDAASFWGEDASNWENIARRSNDYVGNLFADLDLRKFSRLAEYLRLQDDLTKYPSAFPRAILTGYDAESQILVVTRELPNLDELSLNKLDEKGRTKAVTKTEAERFRKLVPCAIALRTASKIISSEYGGLIKAVCFNGEISFTDPADGHRKQETVISVLIRDEDLQSMKLENVDPATAITSLKGRLSQDFERSAPVLPILALDKTDSRIVESTFDLNTLDASTNLAAMDWEQFENLVREVFAKEFSGDDMEVKVTQASRDGGVDAIAFDPDPIRGGKFVFQAKRYTNVVDVSAVRDLYGVVMHEGANRGILVTTSSFGADAYKFAEGKALTLINGNQLLGLLSKYGYQVRIDIEEARRMLAN